MPEVDERTSRRRFFLLVDHGSRSEQANHRLFQIGRQLESFLNEMGRPCEVAAAHMEIAQPDLGEAVRGLVTQGAEEILVVPCMLSPGRHVSEDIPRILSGVRERFPGLRVHLAPPLSALPGFIEFLARAIEDLAPEDG